MNSVDKNPARLTGGSQMATEDGAPLAALPRRVLILILACIILIISLAWIYLIHLDDQMASSMAQDQMMAEMGMAINAPWTAVDVLLTFTMWTVMMIGMMAPSAAPMVLVFAAAQSRRGNQSVSLSAGMFGLGYVLVWAMFSAVAAVAQWVLHETALLSPEMKVLSPSIGGVVLIVAGIYQITPWKSACLTHCRSPLSFLMTHWREGRWGAFEIGRHHGAYCLGCCWALMVILFVVGVMNLAWVAALAAFVLLEKVAPHGALIARISGAALIACGIITIF
jgi:predicted metal-binding membrane protein